MKFIAITKDERGNEMRETMSSLQVHNMQQAREYALAILARFNQTLRPHESLRGLSHIEGMELDPAPPHQWVKDSLVTEKDKTGYYDRMHCDRCSLHGRRYGLGGNGVVPTPSWSQKKSPYIKHCMPEQGPQPVDEPKENVMTFDEKDMTPWYHTAVDGSPCRKGLYMTTADPARPASAMWRFSDGQLRWGPSDKDPQRALDRAVKEKLLLTAPLYWRGLNRLELTLNVEAFMAAGAQAAPATEVPAPTPRDRVRLQVDAQEEQLPLFTPRPRVRLQLVEVAEHGPRSTRERVALL